MKSINLCENFKIISKVIDSFFYTKLLAKLSNKVGDNIELMWEIKVDNREFEACRIVMATFSTMYLAIAEIVTCY